MDTLTEVKTNNTIDNNNYLGFKKDKVMPVITQLNDLLCNYPHGNKQI